MKIALFGTGGTIGSRIAAEALRRGHQVTAVVRDPAGFAAKAKADGINVVQGDVTDPVSIANAVRGHDVVISAVGPGHSGKFGMLVEAARALLDGVARAGVKRLIIVGGAGSLEVAPGVQLMDTPAFPAAWKPYAQAHRDALDVYRGNTTLDWTYVSPADHIEPGERTGHYRTGGEQLVTDAKGESRISTEDYAVAMLDDIEHPAHIRQRFTVAY
jgi:putative NADH-flavin reductase